MAQRRTIPQESTPPGLEDTLGPRPLRAYRIVLDLRGRPVLTNAYHKMHYGRQAKEREAWRADGLQLARHARIPHLERAAFEVWGRYDKGPLPDDDGVAPSFKAARDGIVSAGVLTDDKAAYVAASRYWAPEVVKGCRPGLVVVVREMGADGALAAWDRYRPIYE